MENPQVEPLKPFKNKDIFISLLLYVHMFPNYIIYC